MQSYDIILATVMALVCINVAIVYVAAKLRQRQHKVCPDPDTPAVLEEVAPPQRHTPAAPECLL